MTPAIEVEGLRLVRSGKEVFSVESLNLPKGEVLALVGPNGAGKSSLLLTLALLQTATEGTIRINGQIAHKGNILSLRRRIALVFQEALLLDMSVERNIKTALRLRGVSRQEADVRTGRWLRRFGIEHLAHQSARRLSGGEAQRTSLARAFALEPEILFLDEPFASLDHPTRRSLLKDMRQLLADMRMTTLFVTHDYTEIPHLANRAAVLYEGRIFKSGTITEIFGEEIFQKRTWAPWEF
jgi:tungstate transport system ATP-binding protein